MSDLDTKPPEYTMRCLEPDGPEELLITARRVYLGKTTEVARALPDRQIRMIGAWCFLDHYGPEDVSDRPGMQVWAHPHTGLQTVSWLLEGEIEHRDSVGSLARVRPGELNIMTAGRGIVHTELSPVDKPPTLHGLQLWVALPDAARASAPRFEAFADLPVLQFDGGHGQVLVGELAGVRSRAQGQTPLCAADLSLHPGADVILPLAPGFEHGVFVVQGEVDVESSTTGADQLLYLGSGRRSLRLRSTAGGRLMLLGGQPFEEEIVMWWNFVGRSHAEVAGYRAEWEQRAPRFPPVVDRRERVMEAPPMPTVPLKPRPRRRVAR
ncbi:MAG: pirin family protein [Friedmanniella sp.]